MLNEVTLICSDGSTPAEKLDLLRTCQLVRDLDMEFGSEPEVKGLPTAAVRYLFQGIVQQQVHGKISMRPRRALEAMQAGVFFKVNPASCCNGFTCQAYVIVRLRHPLQIVPHLMEAFSSVAASAATDDADIFLQLPIEDVGHSTAAKLLERGKGQEDYVLKVLQWIGSSPSLARKLQCDLSMTFLKLASLIFKAKVFGKVGILNNGWPEFWTHWRSNLNSSSNSHPNVCACRSNHGNSLDTRHCNPVSASGGCRPLL